MTRRQGPKRCTRCGEDKPLDAFAKRARSGDGLMSSCRACHGSYHAGYRLANRERRRIEAKAYYSTYMTPERVSYQAMVRRCTNPNADQWQWYGGRGVMVCDRWSGRGGFDRFLADMGPRPAGTTLDRIDPNGNYKPSNCRWADARIQRRNQRDAA